MRLHELTMTAFGPFAGTERVDFDALNDAGLFLLSGATGAGKTSILDAVCFALYGTVPGVRGVKALKSQHADEQTAPEVVLDFSVRERRFRIRRTPEWTRPKRRGTGTRTENASASLAELAGDEEHFLTPRASEVGLMVGELIGMRAAQFQQVAMLPQGEFAKFLHASSQDRHDVLQHLFQTDRFTRIEEWVADHSRSLKDRAARGEEAVRRLLHTIADRSGVAVPEPGPGDLPERGGLAWAQELLDAARTDHAALAARRDEVAGDVVAARAAVEELRRRAAVASRRDAARRTLTALEETAEESASAQAAIDADRRAAACGPVVALLDEAAEEVSTCDRARTAGLAALRAHDGVDLTEQPTAEQLDEAAAQVRTTLSRIEALLPRVRALTELGQASAASAAALDDAETSRTQALEQHASLPTRLAETRARLYELSRTAGRRDALELMLTAAAVRADAAARLPEAETALASLADVVRDRRDAAADARDEVLALQARRLAGIAAELAGRLRDGDPCQVCGSTEHPEPAEQAEAAVTDAEQQQADARYDEAQTAVVAATERMSAAEAEVSALRRAAEGLDPQAAEDAQRKLAEELDGARAAEDRRALLEVQVTELGDALDHAAARLSQCEQEVAALGQRHAAAVEAHQRTADEIGQAVPGVDPEDLPAMAAGLGSTLEAITRTRVAVVQHEQAVRRHLEVAGRAELTVVEQGFASVAGVRAGVLDSAARERLQQLLDDRSAREAAARSVLASEEVAELGESPAPDPLSAEAELVVAEELALETGRAADLQAERVDALADLLARLERALDDWGPLHEEHARAESMSRLVRGMGADNQLQMRLSAYVLATRLDHVLDAANERLSHMRDQRYLLQRTARAVRKGSQAGLGLEVVDQWTGDVRAPSTLSGGETFVVSLSLALGLADVVTQEAGGVEIETLFVDEGFGTLDPDTLDDVMDRLDGLRAGGRTVGVVSHVSELRTRIPAQVHVRKTPQGSTVHAETLVG